jgi:hypothetical protein
MIPPYIFQDVIDVEVQNNANVGGVKWQQMLAEGKGEERKGKEGKGS